MNEGKTTGIFAVIAAVAFGLAWWSRPVPVSNESDLERDLVGTPVFASFDDPTVASSFKIIKFDEDLAQLEPFEVTKDGSSGLWRLPSYDDYPADAAEQVRDATTPLVGLKILDIQTHDRGDHSLYGVVNPDDEELSVSESGVGMLVEVKGDDDKVLASLIVGKEVEQAQGQRYVRVPTEDAVYVVEIDTTPFSTDFKKWIKGELLGVRSFDITDINLRDYVVLPTQQGYGMQRNFDADLHYNAEDSEWALDKLLVYESGQAQETPLTEGEELNKTALNDLRNAVQELEIVDVRRKPNGLAADLKADKSLMENTESLQSLYDQGFFPQERPDGVEIFATGGETLVGTDDGVKYLLRFGEATTKLTTEDEGDENGIRRFLLVTSTLDESKFPAPDLQPVPETMEDLDDENALEAKEDETDEEKQERFEAYKETIAKENQRKIDERNEKIDEARKKVQELNARFADWYYVVSDSVYNKLTLSRDQLTTTGEEENDAGEEAAVQLPQFGLPSESALGELGDAAPLGEQDAAMDGESDGTSAETTTTDEAPASGESAGEEPAADGENSEAAPEPEKPESDIPESDAPAPEGSASEEPTPEEPAPAGDGEAPANEPQPE